MQVCGNLSEVAQLPQFCPNPTISHSSINLTKSFYAKLNTLRPWDKMAALSLTHWGRVTHICVSKLTIIGSDNGLSPGRRQAIIWTNVGILLIGPLGANFSEILIEILTFSFKKMRFKVSSAKWRPFCLGLNGLNGNPYHGKMVFILRWAPKLLPGCGPHVQASMISMAGDSFWPCCSCNCCSSQSNAWHGGQLQPLLGPQWPSQHEHDSTRRPQ